MVRGKHNKTRLSSIESLPKKGVVEVSVVVVVLVVVFVVGFVVAGLVVVVTTPTTAQHNTTSTLQLGWTRK